MYAEVKCVKCGWIHASISLAMVMAENNSHEELARYFRCFRCNSPSAAFVPARPGDAPNGCSLQPVFIGDALQSLHEDQD